MWGDKWEDNDYLFPRENGVPMFPGYVCNWLTEFSMRHGLPHINPHAFRHPYVKPKTKIFYFGKIAFYDFMVLICFSNY